jgi:phosphopantetheine--protein transferase-like protein
MIGIDLVHLPRFERTLGGSYGRELEARVFTDGERAEAESRGPGRIRNLACRFAMKEAVIKASLVGLTLADLKRISTGEKSACVERTDGIIDRYFVSGSRSGEYVVAVAIAEDGAGRSARTTEDA